VTDTKRERQRAEGQRHSESGYHSGYTILALIAEVEAAESRLDSAREKLQQISRMDYDEYFGPGADQIADEALAILGGIAPAVEEPLPPELLPDYPKGQSSPELGAVLKEALEMCPHWRAPDDCAVCVSLDHPDRVVQEQRPDFSTLKGRIDAATESREQRPGWLKPEAAAEKQLP
jgi:hypothetical protein